MANEVNHLDELVRLEVLKLRGRVENQNAAIIELNRAGFSPTRIAALLGTTPATVSVAVNRDKRRAASKGASAGGKTDRSRDGEESSN